MSEYVWQPEVLVQYPLVEHVAMAPDGQRVLFTVRRAWMTDESSEFRAQVFVARTDGQGEALPLTFGVSAREPQWSPDGRFVAFLRQGPGEGAPIGVWVMHAEGGEAWPLTGAANGVKNDVLTFRWRPDGQEIAFLAVPHDPERAARKQRRDDVVQWRVDYERAQLHVVAMAVAPEPLPPVRQVTSGSFHVLGFAWHPDGGRLALIHAPTPLADAWAQSRLATIAADGSEALPTDVGLVASWGSVPYYSPDGQWIACEVGEESNSWAYASRVVLFPSQGGEEVTLAAVADESPVLVGWAPDGQAVYVKNQQGICSELVRLPIDGGPGVALCGGAMVIACEHLNGAGQLALVGQDFDHPTSVYVADLTQAPESVVARRVARPQVEGWPDGPLPQVRLLRWQSEDGLEIEGLLCLPADYQEGQGPLPLLLHIHGGPTGVFQRAYTATPYYYTPAPFCERGFAVLQCNPRGSGGYGWRFRLANRRDWGGGDFRDLMQGVDQVIALGIADPERLGVCGWSYGGFMTSWIITQTTRFKAASVGAAVTNPMSFNGTADIPSFIPDYFQAEFWDDFDVYRAQSPIFHVGQVKTPALIQHGECDSRVPLEQGLQFFNALQRRGVPVEMYIYPRQGHAITEPRLLADALARNLEWFGRFLGSK